MMKERTYHRHAHAKINLTLEVIEKMSNGYHKLRTVMMQLPHLFDDIDVVISDVHHDIVIACDDPAVPIDERNICHKTARAFCERTNKKIGMHITLTKRIPAAAGVGGGSSDGAQILLCLNAYYDNLLSQQELIDVAASVGKDIPFFFVESGCALIGGMGEIIVEELQKPVLHVLLVNPCVAVSTPWAFGELVQYLWFMTDGNRIDQSRKMAECIVNGGDIASQLYNDFEIAVFSHHSEIAEIKQSLIAFGASGVLMSGSGATVFGIFTSQEDLRRVQKKITRQYPTYIVVEG